MCDAYDVIVIGAGVAGCCTARELARFDLRVLVLEQGEDVSVGTTRANSGIVHGGYDPEPGTYKARYNIEGSRLFSVWAKELGFEYSNNGSLVVAFSDEERPMLEELYERGLANGLEGEGFGIIEAKMLHEREPNLSPAAVAALWVPTGAICDPYGIANCAAQNAALNGVEFKFHTQVTGIARICCGSDGAAVADGSMRAAVAMTAGASAGNRAGATAAYRIETPQARFEARCVVNAAGLHAGEMNNLVSAHKIEITAVAGEYCLFDTQYGKAFTSTIFQTPTAAGKGVLVTPTTGGNLLIGPDAVPRESYEDTSTTAEGLAGVLKAASKTWEHIPRGGIITNFAGLRAHGTTGDFQIGEPADAPGFFNIAAFESPGLSAAPAVGADIAARVAARLGAASRPGFNPNYHPAPSFARVSAAERAALIAEDPAYGHVICRCEKVTEAEIVAAIHAPLPATTIDAIKWRTRAGMGRCQAGFCLPLVSELLARELGCELKDVCKRDEGSYLVLGSRKEVAR